MSHTKEPWPKPEHDSSDGSGNEWWSIPGVGEIYSEEDARRIVACVNACAGISTENLEDNVPLKELARRYNVALKQRDDLLLALKDAEESLVATINEEYGTEHTPDPASKDRNVIAARYAIAMATRSAT